MGFRLGIDACAKAAFSINAVCSPRLSGGSTVDYPLEGEAGLAAELATSIGSNQHEASNLHAAT